MSSVSLFGLVTGGDAGGSWTDELDASVSDPIDLSGFDAGTYVFTYTVGPDDPDSECDSDTTTVSITIDPLPEIEYKPLQLDCFSESPGISVESPVDKSELEFRLVKKGVISTLFEDYSGPYSGLDEETNYVLTVRNKNTLCENEYEFMTGKLFDQPLNPIVDKIDPDCETFKGTIKVTSRTTGLRFAVLLTSLVPDDISKIPDSEFMQYVAGGFTGYAPGDYTVVAKSIDGCLTGSTPISLVEPICENFEGCTLGYWKNHTDRWTCYSTCTLYGAVFANAPTKLASLTLLEVLNLGGGGIYNLGRQSVAALLNTCHGDIDYEIITTEQLIAYVNANFSNAGPAGSYLDQLNNAGCELGGTKATTAPSESCPQQPEEPVRGKPGKNNKTSVTSGFIASPVPFKDRLSIQYEFEYTSNVTVQVYDLKGQLLRTYKDKKVTKGSVTDLSVDFRMNANQVYIIRVQTEREVFTRNVVSAKR